MKKHIKSCLFLLILVFIVMYFSDTIRNVFGYFEIKNSKIDVISQEVYDDDEMDKSKTDQDINFMLYFEYYAIKSLICLCK